MKHIIKNPESAEFTEWKAQENANWKPSYDKLRGTQKSAVHQSLMREQGYICCYCEQRLYEEDSHIEHFSPQHRDSQAALDYANMLCSCQRKLLRREPRHCGNLKDDSRYEPQLLASPLEPSCELRFSFDGDGCINSTYTVDLVARETIRILGLDIQKLNAMRKAVIDQFLDDTLTQEEVDQLVSAHLAKDNEGKYGEFWTTVNHLFSPVPLRTTQALGADN
jgi:uncharacterized protein (TIGR02646 family)